MNAILRVPIVIVLLAASLFSLAVSRPLQRMNMKEEKQMTKPQIPDLRSHEFTDNPIETTVTRREMRQADTTTSAAADEATPSEGTASSGCGESTTAATDTVKQKQLLDLLSGYYYNLTSSGRETAISFMALYDLFRTGPLSKFGDTQLPNIAISRHRDLCVNVANGLRTDKLPNDRCHWTYDCNFDANRFPSSIINATSCYAEPGSQCIQRVNKEMTFRRTFDENGVATWSRAGEVSVVYGYTCRST